MRLSVMVQASLFEDAPVLPSGMRYMSGLVAPDEEAPLVSVIAALDFRPFRFCGYEGRRRVVSFGWAYDFERGRLERAAPMPDFLMPLQARAAALAGLSADDLPHALVTEYAPGAAIGWHRDRPQFGDVVGVSLGAPCRLRMRCAARGRWERLTIKLPPRSAYLLRGAARLAWEHSIPPVEALRYSVTFRTLAR